MGDVVSTLGLVAQYVFQPGECVRGTTLVGTSTPCVSASWTEDHTNGMWGDESLAVNPNIQADSGDEISCLRIIRTEMKLASHHITVSIYILC